MTEAATSVTDTTATPSLADAPLPASNDSVTLAEGEDSLVAASDTQEQAESESPRTSAKIAAIARAEKRARERREAAERAFEQKVEAFERQRAAILEELQAVRSDPLQYLERQGITFEEMTRRRLAGDDKTPSLEQRVAELAAWKEARERQEAEIALQRQTEATNAQISSAQSAFAEWAKSSEDYPCLAAYPADEIGIAAWQRALEIRKETGREAHREEIAESLELYLRARYNEMHQRLAKLQGPPKVSAPIEAPKAPNGTGTAAPETPTRPRTLSNGHASERANLPANIDDLPPDEKRRHLIAFMNANVWGKGS